MSNLSHQESPDFLSVSYAMVFPGQGSQHPGMGQDILTHWIPGRHLLEQAQDITGIPLAKAMFEDNDPQTLRPTTVAQPALWTVSFALFMFLTQECGIPVTQFAAAAGHSLGEYTALSACQVLSPETVLSLIAQRSQLMQQSQPGSMVAVLGLDRTRIMNIIQDNSWPEGVLVAANDNSPQQVVVSGHEATLQAFAEWVKAHTSAKVIPLPVSGPFHSPAMTEPAQAFETLLCQANWKNPVIPVITNVSGQGQTEAEIIKKHAIQQMTSPVLWTDSVRWMHAGAITHVVEIGPGNVLCGLVKKIHPALYTHAVHDRTSAQQWALGKPVQSL